MENTLKSWKKPLLAHTVSISSILLFASIDNAPIPAVLIALAINLVCVNYILSLANK